MLPQDDLLSLFLRSIKKKENRKAALLYALLLVAVVVIGIIELD